MITMIISFISPKATKFEKRAITYDCRLTPYTTIIKILEINEV
jgi:hypothetical protein